MKLGELLVANNMITVTQLQQALKAQQVYGGKLGTNLVELGLLTETQLTQFLAKQLNLPAAQPSDFSNIPEEVLALIPKDFARQYRAIPLAFQNRKLKVAFGDAMDLEAREKTAFRVGHPVVPVVAPELLINYALEKFYGIPNEKRYFNLNDEQDEGSMDDLILRNQMDYIQSSEMDANSAEVLSHVGAYLLEHLSRDLFNAATRDQVFHCLFRFMEPLFPQMAVFVMRHNEIWGWTQQGFTLDVKQLRRKVMEPTDGSMLARTFINRDLTLAFLPGGNDRKLIEWLGGNPQLPYHLFPMLLSGRVVAALLATGGKAMSAEQVQGKLNDLQGALTKTSIALQMVGLRHKLLIKS